MTKNTELSRPQLETLITNKAKLIADLETEKKKIASEFNKEISEAKEHLSELMKSHEDLLRTELTKGDEDGNKKETDN